MARAPPLIASRCRRSPAKRTVISGVHVLLFTIPRLWKMNGEERKDMNRFLGGTVRRLVGLEAHFYLLHSPLSPFLAVETERNGIFHLFLLFYLIC